MAVNWITQDEYEKAGQDERQVLLEQTPDYYPEFAQFIQGELDRAGGALHFRGESGAAYRAAMADPGQSEGLSGFEVRARASAAPDASADGAIDLDLWPLMEWIIEGVGGEWKVEDLQTTGAIYRVPGAKPAQ